MLHSRDREITSLAVMAGRCEKAFDKQEQNSHFSPDDATVSLKKRLFTHRISLSVMGDLTALSIPSSRSSQRQDEQKAVHSIVLLRIRVC